ncbi:MAG: HigA family addiction module antitoxin [Rickettsiales bacterium]
MNMKNPSHPGEIIRECIEGSNLNVTEAANVLGVTRAALSRVVNAKASVSPEMAVRLSKAFGSTIGFWLRLQLNFDLAQMEKKSSKIRVRRIVSSEQIALQ